MFESAREKYKNSEHKLLIAKVIDKYEFSKTKNKITYTDFLNISEISIVKKILKEENVSNFVIFGGKEEADRNVIIFYPEKFSEEMVEKNYEKIFEVIRIKLPNNIKYEHREFLSGIMKLGIKREKFGDILVTEFGADIIALAEISKVLANDLKTLTRFRKSEITVENINDLTYIETEFENINIIVSSIRLDNFVSELANCSRKVAEDYIKLEKVLLNNVVQKKGTKLLKEKDILTIRGNGKYIIDMLEGKNKKEREVVLVRKYI